MGGLGPADAAGNYTRPSSDPLTPPALNPEDLLQRSADQRPILVIGRSCPWAHRTWLVHQLRHLQDSVTLVMARADHDAGRWALNPAWEGCKTLLELYQHCGAPPATGPPCLCWWIPRRAACWAMTVHHWWSC